MAGLEDGFVANLAKQNAGRVKYARVISWELSRDAEEEDPAEKRKKRRSYERKMRKEKRMGKNRREEENRSEDEASSRTSSSSSQGTSEELETNNEGENAPDMKVLSTNKISKKAKNRLGKEAFESGVCELGAIELDGRSDIVDSSKTITEFSVQNKPVPSLVDLCLRVDWKARDSEYEIKISDIAPGLRDMVRAKQQMCRINAKHLKCHHKTLALGEKEIDDFLETCGNGNEDDENAPKRLQRSVCSVFSNSSARSGYSHCETLAKNYMEEGGHRTYSVSILDGK